MTAAHGAGVLDGPSDLDELINSTGAWMPPGTELAARLGLAGPDPATVRAPRINVHAALVEMALDRAPALLDSVSAAGAARPVVGER